MRRVKRIQQRIQQQAELFSVYRHHAFVTNSTLSVVEADERHRDHAVVEQVIAELKDGPLAHLPSGKYAANAAWLALAVIAFNLARAAATAAGMPEGPLGDSAPTDHRHPRPDRDHQPPSRPRVNSRLTRAPAPRSFSMTAISSSSSRKVAATAGI